MELDEVEREALLSGEDEEETHQLEETNEERQEEHQPSHDIHVVKESGLQSVRTGAQWLLRSWPVVELKELVKLSVPTILMFFFQQFVYIVAVLFAGHISGNSRELDAASLAISVMNVTGFSVIIGLSAAADTLCPQSFGFKNYKRVGEILQQGILILFIAVLPVIALWLNSQSILLLLQQQPCVARLASQFMMIGILMMPPQVVLVMMQKYLQAQSVVWVFAIAGLILILLTSILSAVFIYALHLGLYSISVAIVISMYLAVLFLLAYVKVRGLHKLTWGGWSFESLRKWGLFLKLGLPGFFMLAFEWWTFEITVLVSGSIGETQQGVNTILIQLLSIAFMLPYGMGTAASVRVGNELGAGNPQRARRASYTAVAVQFVVAASLVIILGLSHDVIARIFTEDEEVIAVTSYTIYPGIAVFFFDQIQGVMSGVFRGAGRQLMAASVNFVVYYLIGLPIGICLALLTSLETLGLWAGLAVSSVSQCSIFTIVLLTMNWDKLAKRAMKNASGESPSVSSLSQESTTEGSLEENGVSSSQENGEVLSHEEAKEALSPEEGNPHQDSVDEIPLVSMENKEDPLSPDPSYTLTGKGEMSVTTRKKERVKLILSKGVFVLMGISLVVASAVLAGVFRHEDLVDYCEAENNSTCQELCANVSSSHDQMPQPTPTISVRNLSSQTDWLSTSLSCACSVVLAVSPTPYL